MNTREADELYAYDRWASARVLDAVAPLDAADFTKDMKNSYPSIRDTLVHIMSANWIWLRRWHGESPTAPPNGWTEFGYDALRTQWREIETAQAAFVTSLTDDALTTSLAYRNLRGDSFTVPLETLLRHVVNHASYHRGQVTTMLRQLGAAAVATDLVLYHTSLPTPAR